LSLLGAPPFPKFPTAVESYVAIDLSPDGEPARSLFAEADDEARNPAIQLTDHVGPLPGNLTPAMARWYAAHVAGPRSAALDEVAGVLGENDAEAGTRGTFLEREISRAEDQRLAGKRQVVKAHREKNEADYERLAEARIRWQKARNAYDELHARHGREARRPPWWYIPSLFVIGIAEMLVNYESFAAVKIFTPAIATGTTILVALALACSSHCYGTFLRQVESRFGAFRRDGDRAAAARILGLGTVCLSLVLGAVWYARTSYLADELIEIAVIGGAAPSWISVVGGSMITNMVVWIVGVILAFFAHDEDHAFPVALDDRDKAEKAMRALQNRINQPIQRQFESIDAQCDRNIGQLRTKEQSLANSPRHAEGRKLFARIKEQDARVLSVIDAYRGRLRTRARDSAIVFRKQAELMPQPADTLDADQYAAEPIVMKYT
jgi:hypothetical protein